MLDPLDCVRSAGTRAILLVLDDLGDELALAARDARLEIIGLVLHGSTHAGIPLLSTGKSFERRPTKAAPACRPHPDTVTHETLAGSGAGSSARTVTRSFHAA